MASTPSAMRSGLPSRCPIMIGSSPTRSMPSARASTSGWNMIQWNRSPGSPSGMRRSRAPNCPAAAVIAASASG
ncbi:MAG: hypothetical protein R2692_02335 [Microbacterium sp.]